MVFKKGHQFYGDKSKIANNLKDKDGKVWNDGLKKGDHPSIEKMGYQEGHEINVGRKHTEEAKQKMSLSNPKLWKGKKPWNYIDGRSKHLGLERYGGEWKKIRQVVLKRDNYSCQECNLVMDKTERGFHIHHIIPFLESKNNSLNNLITLCPSCHRKIETKIMRKLKNKGNKND